MPFKDKEQHAAWRLQRQRDNASWVAQYKESHPCSDCGLYWPSYVMQFDHLRDKVLKVSAMMNSSRQRILSEIEKCELVCANCHAVRTHNRGVASQTVETLVCEASVEGSTPSLHPNGTLAEW